LLLAAPNRQSLDANRSPLGLRLGRNLFLWCRRQRSKATRSSSEFDLVRPAVAIWRDRRTGGQSPLHFDDCIVVVDLRSLATRGQVSQARTNPEFPHRSLDYFAMFGTQTKCPVLANRAHLYSTSDLQYSAYRRAALFPLSQGVSANKSHAVLRPSYFWQNRVTPSCSAATLENPRAEVASSILPN
jgi:hypothetical protein